MPDLKIKILQYTDNSNPGWVKCAFPDIQGQIHYFEEKIPIVTLDDLDENSQYPQDGVLECKIIETSKDKIKIDIGLRNEGQDGQTIFEVSPDQIA